MFKIQIKDGPNAKWRDIRFDTKRFATEAEAQAYGRSFDQDGDWNPRAMRVVEVSR